MRKILTLILALIASPALAADYEISASSYATIQSGLFAIGFAVGPNAVSSVPNATALDGKGDQYSLSCYGAKYLPTAFTPSTYGPYVTSTGALTLAFATAPGLAAGANVTISGFTGADASLNGQWVVASSLNGGKSLGVTTVSGLGTLSFTGQSATMTSLIVQNGSYCIFRWLGPNAVPTINGVTLIPIPANSPVVWMP